MPSISEISRPAVREALVARDPHRARDLALVKRVVRNAKGFIPSAPLRLWAEVQRLHITTPGRPMGRELAIIPSREMRRVFEPLLGDMRTEIFKHIDERPHLFPLLSRVDAFIAKQEVSYQGVIDLAANLRTLGSLKTYSKSEHRKLLRSERSNFSEFMYGGDAFTTLPNGLLFPTFETLIQDYFVRLRPLPVSVHGMVAVSGVADGRHRNASEYALHDLAHGYQASPRDTRLPTYTAHLKDVGDRVIHARHLYAELDAHDDIDIDVRFDTIHENFAEPFDASHFALPEPVKSKLLTLYSHAGPRLAKLPSFSAPTVVASGSIEDMARRSFKPNAAMKISLFSGESRRFRDNRGRLESGEKLLAPEDMTLARNDDPAEILGAGWQSLSQEALTALVRSKLTGDPHYIWGMMNGVEGQLARMTAQFPQFLPALVAHPSCELRQEVAKSATDAGALKQLARDANAQVRRTVGENPSAPSELLRVLSHDFDPEVRRAVLFNPNTPEDVIIREDQRLRDLRARGVIDPASSAARAELVMIARVRTALKDGSFDATSRDP